jgi:hypothetical protein
MEYKCYELDSGGVREANFLNRGATEYLANCHDEVFQTWKERNTPTLRDVSLAYSLTPTLIKKFKKKTIGIDREFSSSYGVSSLFQHTNDTAGKIAEMFYESRNNEYRDILVLTQSPEFKITFNYDSSTITFQYLVNAFHDFVEFFRPPFELRLLLVELRGFPYQTSVFKRGEKEYLSMSYGQHS